MILNSEAYELNGRSIILRSATEDDAEMLLDYIKTVTGETRFLICEPDEIKYTIDGEKAFIKSHNDSDSAMLMLAFVDGEYAGNCSFSRIHHTRRKKHRAEIGIALFQRFTGFGLGRLMLERLLQVIKEMGYEQAELTVHSDNARAHHLYESLGFKDCGRIPNASKFDDGTYGDDVLMVLPMSEVK